MRKGPHVGAQPEAYNFSLNAALTIITNTLLLHIATGTLTSFQMPN